MAEVILKIGWRVSFFWQGQIRHSRCVGFRAGRPFEFKRAWWPLMPSVPRWLPTSTIVEE